VIARRDLLIGAACVVAGGAAYALKPRRRVSLQGALKLEQIVPRTIAGWTSRDVSDLVAPKIEGSLASKLYGETVGRVYTHAATGADVMMLLAHGDTQSNDLQLHRPEVCYPFFGFEISGSQPFQLPLPGGAALPARRLVATAPERIENIIYWSRLGEYLPTDGREQRVDRFMTAIHGFVSDGLLARFSMVGEDHAAAFTLVTGFIQDLIRSVQPNLRLSLIGTQRAGLMASAKV
jgi:EpsI family protein